MIKKILLANSGTGNTEEMLKYLLDFPSLKSAEITMLHVISSRVKEEEIAAKTEQGQQLLAQAVETLKLDSTQVNTLLKQGEPKDLVLKVAAEIDADLIIMGSRALKKLQAILENSVSQYVFQLTDRPMLLVKDDLYVKKIKRVMIALDKSNASKYALDVALFLLRGMKNVQLVLARVNPDLNPAILPLSAKDIEENPVLAPAINQVKRAGLDYRAIVTGGRPAKQICALAQENNVDLLILGSPDRRPSIAKGLPDLERLLGSSLSDYVRVNADCPVLLARRTED